MASAAVKLPLSIKKAIKDSEPDYKKELDLISALIGSPVTFNWNVESVYAATEGHEYQKHMATATVEYLTSLREGMQKQLKDEMTKAHLLTLWTTKNITLTVEPESFDAPEYVTTHLAAWNLYNGIRLVNGDLDIFTKKDRFFANVNYLFQIEYVKVLDNALIDGLTLLIRQELRDEAKKIEEVKSRIAKATGVDSVKWDIESDAKAISLRKDLRYPFSVDFALQYMNGLADCLDKHCKDDMVKEAVADAFSSKTVSFKCYDSMDGIKGLEVHNNYNGIQFLDGQLIVFTQASNYATNINQVSYEHDIVKLF